MRRVLIGVLLFIAGCSKCSTPRGEAGLGDAGAAALTDAGASAALPDAGPEPSEAELLAAYARDCDYVVQSDACGASDGGAPCAPDPFGCCAKGEECRAGCGSGCEGCAAACGSSCRGCRASCETKAPGERSSCVSACAKARLLCRRDCLGARAKCVSDACATAESACEDDGLARRQKACPDCAELGQCLWEEGYKDDPPKCLMRYPENAKECLEWCFQE